MGFMTIEQIAELIYLRWCEFSNPGKPVNVTWERLSKEAQTFWTDCVFIVSSHTTQYAMQPKSNLIEDVPANSPYPAWRYEEAKRLSDYFLTIDGKQVPVKFNNESDNEK